VLHNHLAKKLIEHQDEEEENLTRFFMKTLAEMFGVEVAIGGELGLSTNICISSIAGHNGRSNNHITLVVMFFPTIPHLEELEGRP